jgi:hypothetical protein
MSLAQMFTHFWWFENNAAPPEPISVSIGRDFNLGHVEGELEEKAMLTFNSREFGKAGLLYRIRAFIAAVSEEPFTPSNKLEDEAIKGKILDKLNALAEQVEQAPDEDIAELFAQVRQPEANDDTDVLAGLDADDAEAANREAA